MMIYFILIGKKRLKNSLDLLEFFLKEMKCRDRFSHQEIYLMLLQVNKNSNHYFLHLGALYIHNFFQRSILPKGGCEVISITRDFGLRNHPLTFKIFIKIFINYNTL